MQDESRVGQQTSSSRVYAKKGSNPTALKQQEFKSTYISGAVCSSSGKHAAFIAPVCNTHTFNETLKIISKETPPDRFAVVITDNAPWHKSGEVQQFDNLEILFLPPYSPELNFMEQVWCYLKQYFLSNRVFSGYDHIVEALSDAWNAFTNNVPLLKSLCSRDWAIL